MTTEERVEKLEIELARANRHNRWLLAVGLTIAACVAVYAGALRPAPVEAQGADGAAKEVRAGKFTLVGENGKTRATLSADKDLSMLSLYDDKGNPRAAVTAEKDGAGLYVHDENGIPRAGLVMLKDVPKVWLCDENAEARAILSADKDGAGLELFDEKGKERAVLKADVLVGPSIELKDVDGRLRADLSVQVGGMLLAERMIEGGPNLDPAHPVMQKGMARLSVRDDKGRRRATLDWTDRGPMIELRDEDGKPRVAVAVGNDGPALSLFDEKGTIGATLLMENHGPVLRLFNENGKPIAALGTGKEGPLLGMMDENSVLRVMISALKGGPALLMFDEKGKVIWQASR